MLNQLILNNFQGKWENTESHISTLLMSGDSLLIRPGPLVSRRAQRGGRGCAQLCPQRPGESDLDKLGVGARATDVDVTVARVQSEEPDVLWAFL